jgi:hypothetical protein
MSDSLASKSKEELFKIGERICRSHDERWIALWAYNIHRLFRSRFREREVWKQLDELVQKEWDWHLGKELFDDVRKETLAAERGGQDAAEYIYLCLGEVTAKSISNASWRPGLFDVDAFYRVPGLAFELAKALGDTKAADLLHYHLMGLFQHEQSKRHKG